METLGTTSADSDDPLIKAALGDVNPGKQASYDDELGGLSGRFIFVVNNYDIQYSCIFPLYLIIMQFSNQ